MAWRLSLQNKRENRTKSHLDRTEAKMGTQGCEHNKDAFGSEEGHHLSASNTSCPQERQFLS